MKTSAYFFAPRAGRATCSFNVTAHFLGRITLSLALVLILSTQAFAQIGQEDPSQETLLGGELRSSGYGAVSMKFTPIQGQLGTLVGGYGGWLINKTLLIGGGGYGLITNIPASAAANLPGRSLSLGYGGIVLEYIGMSDRVFHYGVQTMIGWGGASYYTPRTGNQFNNPRTFIEPNASSGIFVVEPTVYAELNVLKWLRLNLGGGYRFVSGVDMPGLSNADLSNYSITLQLKFGTF